MRSLAGFSRSPNNTAMQETLMRRVLNRMTAAVVVAALAGTASAQSLTKITIATGVDPAFSQFYVAKEGGLFERNGLDVTINTGPSGSAMVPFLINNQVQAAYGSDLSGVINHQIDNNVVAVADGTYLIRWTSLVSRNIENLGDLKGRKVGIARGTGSESFWNELVEKRHLNPADYKIVDVEAPEMLAALERGDIDSFVAWEPWPTRTLMAVKGSKILQDSNGIYNSVNFVYMNRGWIEKNKDTAERFVRALIEANDLIGKDRPAAAKMVAKFLKMPVELATELMPKVDFDMTWTDRSIASISVSVKQLAQRGKLKEPFDYSKYVYMDLVKKVRPENVTLTALPGK
jgi:ABC-type nitrate/sulfonate/bicarbonate transport system substrate-binding protein